MNYEYRGRVDPRTIDSREAAISVLLLLQRSANGNGAAGLALDYLTKEMSWYSFTPAEQRAVAKCLRNFARELRREGFLPEKG